MSTYITATEARRIADSSSIISINLNHIFREIKKHEELNNRNLYIDYIDTDSEKDGYLNFTKEIEKILSDAGFKVHSLDSGINVKF